MGVVCFLLIMMAACTPVLPLQLTAGDDKGINQILLDLGLPKNEVNEPKIVAAIRIAGRMGTDARPAISQLLALAKITHDRKKFETVQSAGQSIIITTPVPSPIQEEACLALGRIGDSSAAQLLVDLYLKEKYLPAHEALVLLGPPATSKLLPYMGGEDSRMGAQAEAVLKKLPIRKTEVARFNALLNSNSKETREAAERMLANARDSVIFQLLKKELLSNDAAVHISAIQRLLAIITPLPCEVERDQQLEAKFTELVLTALVEQFENQPKPFCDEAQKCIEILLLRRKCALSFRGGMNVGGVLSPPDRGRLVLAMARKTFQKGFIYPESGWTAIFEGNSLDLMTPSQRAILFSDREQLATLILAADLKVVPQNLYVPTIIGLSPDGKSLEPLPAKLMDPLFERMVKTSFAGPDAIDLSGQVQFRLLLRRFNGDSGPLSAPAEPVLREQIKNLGGSTSKWQEWYQTSKPLAPIKLPDLDTSGGKTANQN